MVLRHALLAAVIAGIAGTASAQTTPSTTPGQPPAHATTKDMATAPMAADASKLVKRNIKNPDGDTIGEIESIYVDAAGKVDSVIVSVGGFLGVGERYAQLKWKDLHVSDNGEKVTVNMTKDQLKAMAPYKYKDEAVRGHVFTDRGVWKDDRRAATDTTRTTTTTTTTDTAPANRDRMAADTRPSTTPTESTGDFNVRGEVSANALIGAKVRNDNKDTVGTVQDVYLDGSGNIKTVVLSVGGFLGVGAKDVAVKWSDLKQGRDGKSIVLTTALGKDELKSMPDYKEEKRQPSQAAAPK